MRSTRPPDGVPHSSWASSHRSELRPERGILRALAHQDGQYQPVSPWLGSLIEQITSRDYGTPPTPASGTPDAARGRHQPPGRHAGLDLVETDVTVQHTTMAERKAWAQPGLRSPEQRLLLRTAVDDPAGGLWPGLSPRRHDVTITSWLVVVAQLDGTQTCSEEAGPSPPSAGQDAARSFAADRPDRTTVRGQTAQVRGITDPSSSAQMTVAPASGSVYRPMIRVLLGEVGVR